MNPSHLYAQYGELIPIARTLYEHTRGLSLQMLLPLFLLSVAIGYTSDLGIAGAVLIRLKRLVLVALLLAIFPYVAETMQILGVEIAKSIDDMSGIDKLLEEASQTSARFSHSLKDILLGIPSSIISTLLFFPTYFLLTFAPMFLLAFQHFYWFLLVSVAPFSILGLLFESSSALTRGLFKNLFQVAAWPIAWSVLSAFVKAIPYTTVYAGNAPDLVAIAGMNLLFAIALLCTPLVVAQLTEGAGLSVGANLRDGFIKATALVAGPKSLVVQRVAGIAQRISNNNFHDRRG